MQLFSFFPVGQSDIFLYLRHWSPGLLGVLLSAFINGNHQRHIGRCHFRFRLLSPSHGRIIGNKCSNNDSVSESRPRNVIYFSSFNVSSDLSFFKGHRRDNSDGAVNSMVCGVGVEAFRDVALNGSPATARRISGCFILRRLRSYHYLLRA